MRTLTPWITVLMLAPGLAAATATRAQGPGAIRWEPYRAEVGGRAVEGAQLGRLQVQESRTGPTGRMVDLAFVRLPGRRAGGTPTVYLDGGPGGSGVGVLEIPGWAPLLDGLREVGDVILLSQRGTGLSRPRLACGPTGVLAGEAFATRESMLAATLPSVRACVEQWRDRVDLTSFNTRESANDVENLRKALGVEQVNLLGFSYGTHLGLAVLRQHGSSVARAVLAGTEGPDHTFKLPGTFDTHLRTLAYLVARDSSTADDFPDLYAALDSLLGELDESPRLVDVGEGARVAVGGDALRYLLRLDISDSNDLPLLPALLQDVRAENAPLLAALVRRRYSAVGRGVLLMGIAMDCASGASETRMGQIRLERPRTLFAGMTETTYPDVCEVVSVPRLDDSFREPVRSTVPTLFVSGTLDANTPPHQAEEVRWGFPNSAHLVVGNAGHESTLTDPEVQAAIFRFLGTGEMRSAFLPRPPLDFLSREEVLARLGGR